jgi:GntR family transcriptional regulator
VLDRNSKVPLHVQLRDCLRQGIVKGTRRPGEPFPTEREISEKYHVSRTTIREAITDLVQLGYIVRQQGKGTFVARSHNTFDANTLSSFTEDMVNRGFTAGTKLLRLELQAPNETSQQHFGNNIEALWYILRLRLANDEPIALQASYMPANRFEFKNEELAEGSLYRLLAERYGISVTSADEVISASIADPEQAELLKVKAGSALLSVDRFAYSQVGEPVEYVTILYRADRYKFFAHQSRGG